MIKKLLLVHIQACDIADVHYLAIYLPQVLFCFCGSRTTSCFSGFVGSICCIPQLQFAWWILQRYRPNFPWSKDIAILIYCTFMKEFIFLLIHSIANKYGIFNILFTNSILQFKLFKYQTYNSLTGSCDEWRIGTPTQYKTAAIHCRNSCNSLGTYNIMPHIYR